MNKKSIYIGSAILAIIILCSIPLLRKNKIVNYPPKNDTVIAFGDSLVEGTGASKGQDFVSLLGNKMGTEIINLGFSGQTSRDAVVRVGSVISMNPGTVIVLFGGNDFLQKVPKEETFRNLREVVEHIQASGAMVVLLGIRGGALNDPYRTAFDKLAKDTGSIYVPDVLKGLFADNRYMSDAVHPNNAGYKIIAERVYNAILIK